MKTTFITAALVAMAVHSIFSSPQTAWSPGVLVTNENQLLQGEVRYNYAHDILIYRESPQAKLQTFSAQQVASFRYYNGETKRVHYFQRYFYQENEYLTRPAFFEVVVLGDISYLRRHNGSAYFDETDQRRFSTKKSARISPHIMCYDYYVHLDGEIIRSRRFKKEVLPWLVNRNIAIKNHMRKYRLSANYVDDQIRLIQYANEQLGSQIAFSESTR